MKLNVNVVGILIVLILLPLSALAQDIGVSSSSSGSCNSGNAENLGQHIIDYLLCGASFLHPKATLFGTLSLVLNTICLLVSLYLIGINGLKYVAFTMQYGVPGGQKIQGGMMVIRSGILATLLAPIVSNGFSPIQVVMRNFTELGAYFADIGTSRTIKFISSEGSVTNIDPSNIDEVTEQIIASEMCAKLFYLHHKQDVTNNALTSDAKANSVKAVTDQSSLGNVQIRWDYFDPFSTGSSNDNWFSHILTGKENFSEKGVCGSLKINMPKALNHMLSSDIHYDAGSDSFTYSNLKGWQQPYAETFNGQYRAVKAHILNIRNIVNSVSDDLAAISAASALASQNPSDNATLDQIQAAQNSEVSGSQSITSSADSIVNQLVAANAQYRENISAVGSSAAAQISTTNNVVSPDCDEPSPSSIAAPCVPNESWEQQLDRQGFAALGAYYYVYMTINQKIIALQEHLVEPSKTVELYDFAGKNEVIKAIKESQTSFQLAKRTDSLLSEFRKHVDSSTFKMSFSAVENMGNTAEEMSPSNPASYVYNQVSSMLTKGLSFIPKLFAQILKGSNDKGDLIIHLVNIGIVLGNIATGLLALILLAKVVPIGRVATAALSKMDNKLGSGQDGGTSLGSMLMWTILILYALAGLLQYGIPAIPMFKWLLELQSWAIMMFMSFIYAPLWIMAHAAITDDRFMAEQTMTGYGLLFELITRPLLMVFSFFAMILLLHIADIGFQMMLSYLLGMMSLGGSGIVGIIFVLFISLLTAYQLAMRTFDVIAQLPDFIIQRINFGARPLGDTTNDTSHSRFFATGMRLATAGTTNVVGSAAKAMGLIPKK